MEYSDFWSVMLPYAVVTCEVKLFQLASTSVWNNFISARGHLPEVISDYFSGLLQLKNIFQHVQCRWNNFGTPSAGEIILLQFSDVVTCEIKLFWSYFVTCHHCWWLHVKQNTEVISKLFHVQMTPLRRHVSTVCLSSSSLAPSRPASCTVVSVLVPAATDLTLFTYSLVSLSEGRCLVFLRQLPMNSSSTDAKIMTMMT